VSTWDSAPCKSSTVCVSHHCVYSPQCTLKFAGLFAVDEWLPQCARGEGCGPTRSSRLDGDTAASRSDFVDRTVGMMRLGTGDENLKVAGVEAHELGEAIRSPRRLNVGRGFMNVILASFLAPPHASGKTKLAGQVHTHVNKPVFHSTEPPCATHILQRCSPRCICNPHSQGRASRPTT
jgi:hypothetical protein